MRRFGEAFGGDEVKLFLSDETIEKFSEVKIQKVRKRKLDVVYEDDDIILINKPAGRFHRKQRRRMNPWWSI